MPFNTWKKMSGQIMRSYNRRAANFPAEAQYLFRLTLKDHLGQSLINKVKWLALVSLHHGQGEQC
jgi:hypothetical protein